MVMLGNPCKFAIMVQIDRFYAEYGRSTHVCVAECRQEKAAKFQSMPLYEAYL